MLLIDGEVALASISNCQATTWATIWVNTDEYSPIAGKTNRFIYYEFAGKSRNRNNVGLKAIKVNGTWQVAYCLEPGIAEGSTYTEEDMTMHLCEKDAKLVWQEVKTILPKEHGFLYLGSTPAPTCIDWTEQISGR